MKPSAFTSNNGFKYTKSAHSNRSAHETNSNCLCRSDNECTIHCIEIQLKWWLHQFSTNFNFQRKLLCKFCSCIKNISLMTTRCNLLPLKECIKVLQDSFGKNQFQFHILFPFHIVGNHYAYCCALSCIFCNSPREDIFPWWFRDSCENIFLNCVSWVLYSVTNFQDPPMKDGLIRHITDCYC